MNNFWNERYAEDEFAYGQLPNEFLKEQLSKVTPGSILFVCEGEGRNAVYAAQNQWNVEAFDLSEEGKKKAMRLAGQKGVSFNYQIQDAVLAEYPENSFDVIALIYAHFPADIRANIHQKLVRWLKPGGLVILEAFNPGQLNNATGGGPKDPAMLYTEEMLKQDFEQLKIQLSRLETVILNEGKYHSGKADVIRFVGYSLLKNK